MGKKFNNEKEKFLYMLNLNRETVINDYNSAKNRNEELFLDHDVKASSEYIFENQKFDAAEIIDMFFKNDLRCLSLIKRTKVGMDGLMIEVAKNITTHNDNDFMIHRSNVIFLTGMSNKSWEDDFKDKIPYCFKENVYHHGKLHLCQDKLKNINNALIIIDEIDTGDKEEQILHGILREAGLLDIKYMEKNNIRFLLVSATIKPVLNELKKWGDKHDNYSMTIPDNYISHGDFLEFDIIKEYYEINNYESAKKWIEEDIINNYGKDFRVHIIRTDKDNIDYIKKACLENNISFISHTSEDKILHEELTDIFDNKCKNKHIVLAIKGYYRRATFIPNQWKKKIGTLHERYVKNLDTNVQIQGLIGRMTGYWKDDITNGHKTGPYRTSIKSINQYEVFFKDPSNQKLKYSKSGSKKSLVNPRNIENLQTKNNEMNNIKIEEFDTFKEAKNFVINTLKKTGPHNPYSKDIVNKDGFLEYSLQGTRKVWSKKEIDSQKKYGLNNNDYSLRYYYLDINDKDTLEFAVVYNEKLIK